MTNPSSSSKQESPAPFGRMLSARPAPDDGREELRLRTYDVRAVRPAGCRQSHICRMLAEKLAGENSCQEEEDWHSQRQSQPSTASATQLAVIQGRAPLLTGSDTLAGQAFDVNSVFVRFTYRGDADLD
jgi:hypothetical protein